MLYTLVYLTMFICCKKQIFHFSWNIVVVMHCYIAYGIFKLEFTHCIYENIAFMLKDCYLFNFLKCIFFFFFIVPQVVTELIRHTAVLDVPFYLSFTYMRIYGINKLQEPLYFLLNFFAVLHFIFIKFSQTVEWYLLMDSLSILYILKIYLILLYFQLALWFGK